MAAYTDSLGFNKGVAAYDANGLGAVTKLEVKLDFAKIVAARAAAGVAALAATDTLQIIQLPAGSIVLAGGLFVVSAETTNTTATFDLGFTGGTPAAANAFADDAASNSTGLKAANLANPTVVAAADTVDLLLNTAVPANCVVNAFVIVADAS
jgi:hypothetical protein